MHDAGDSSVLKMLPKIDKIRFAVGRDDGPRSCWWFVQIEDKGDVYMSVNSIAADMKLSLHRPSDDERLDRFCQFGFTKTRISKARDAGLAVPLENHFLRWQRPPTPDTGILHVMSLYIPTDFLLKNPPSNSSTKTKFLYQPPLSGYAMEFGLYYSMEPPDILEEKLLQFCRPMFYNKVQTGDVIFFTDRVVSFDARAFLNREWVGMRSLPLSPNHPELKPGASVDGLTAFIPNDPHKDGVIRIWEVSNLKLINKEYAPET